MVWPSTRIVCALRLIEMHLDAMAFAVVDRTMLERR